MHACMHTRMHALVQRVQNSSVYIPNKNINRNTTKSMVYVCVCVPRYAYRSPRPIFLPKPFISQFDVGRIKARQSAPSETLFLFWLALQITAFGQICGGRDDHGAKVILSWRCSQKILSKKIGEFGLLTRDNRGNQNRLPKEASREFSAGGGSQNGFIIRFSYCESLAT